MFKLKNKKVITGDTRITLDAQHNKVLKQFENEQKTITLKEKQLDDFRKRLSKIKSKNNDIIDIDNLNKIFTFENKIKKLENELETLYNKDNEVDYYIKSGKLLYEYYDDLNMVAENNKNNSIVSLITNSNNQNTQNQTNEDDNIINYDNREEDNTGKICDYFDTSTLFDRADKLDQFMRIIEPSYCPKTVVKKNVDNCPKCKKEMLLNHAEGYITCPICGYMEYVVIDSDKPSYKDPPPEATYFAYKRINHFNELLNQIQAKESTDIPQEVFDDIRNEIKKERITDLSKLTIPKMRSYLKKLRLNKYYEHIPHIINKLNGLPPPILTRDIEEKLRVMFKEIQEPFMEVCPKDRRNFLNYYYVLHKFVELLGLDEYKSLFPLLKSKDKLHLQDTMWKQICGRLKWQFIKSI